MPYIPYLISCLLGLLFIIFGGHFYLKLIQLNKNGIRVEGRIVERELRHIKDSDFSSYYYFYVVEYLTLNGTTIRSLSTEGTSKKLEVGEQIPIIYDPNQEEEFSIFLEEQKRLFLFFILMGFLALLFSFAILIKQYHSSK